MALENGTNCGFVSTAPTADPAETAIISDTVARGLKVIAPPRAIVITEIGWWCDNATEESNFEVGLYAHDAGNNKPGTQLFVSATNAKGTTAGWKTATVNWSIAAGTVYWITVQVDDTATVTNGDGVVSAEDRISKTINTTSLPDPWAETSIESAILWSIYAVYKVGSAMTLKTRYWGT